jgi:hypothetical protein
VPRPSPGDDAARQAGMETGLGVLYVRHTGPLNAIVPRVTSALRQIDPHVPVLDVRTMEKELSDNTWTVRTLTRLLMLFAGWA